MSLVQSERVDGRGMCRSSLIGATRRCRHKEMLVESQP